MTTILEFLKDEPCTHPQLGDSLPYTAVDVYCYEDGYRETGFGIYGRRIKYKCGIKRTVAVRLVKKLMIADGFRLVGIKHQDDNVSKAMEEVMSAIINQ